MGLLKRSPRLRGAHGLLAGFILLHGPTSAAGEVMPPATLPAGGMITVCDDLAEFPPYTYYQRAGGQPTETVTGISYDLLAAMLKKHQLSLQVTLLPWKRCTEEVRTGKYLMLMNATLTPERSTQYYSVGPHATLWTYYFYSKQLHPDGLAIQTLADLRKYRICAMMGYNSEEPFGLPKGFVDQGSRDFGSMIRKVLAGHCDLFNESLDMLQGFAKIGRPLLTDPRLAAKILPPELKPAYYYFLVSRVHPQGKGLAALLNAELERMKASGELKRIQDRYSNTSADAGIGSAAHDPS